MVGKPDVWNPKDEPQPKRNLNRETYDAGDEATFLQYAKQIQSREVRTKIMRIRVMLKMNNDLVFSQAYKILEELIEENLEGKLQIAREDYVAWEMMGRAYHAIMNRYSLKLNPENADPNFSAKAWKRAIECYAKAKQHKRVMLVYEQETIDDKFMRNVDQIRSAEVRTGLIRIQVMRKLSGEVPFRQAHHILEELISDHFAGKLKVEHDDCMAWELMGRAYEAIANKNSPKINPNGARDICIKASDRAMYCYAEAQNHEGARRVYKIICEERDSKTESVKSKEACISIMRIDLLYRLNDDVPVKQAYDILEELLAKYHAGKIKIGLDDIRAWQMIGRVYEVIADKNLPKNNPEGDPDISVWASARAMYCYARTEEDARARRIRRTYENSLIAGLMDKLRKIIADKGLEKELGPIISQLPSRS